MFEISGNNFNDWFRRLKLSLRVEKKMHVIEQPLPPAPEPVADPNVVAEWTALYDAHTEIASLMLGKTSREWSGFGPDPNFHAANRDEGKPSWPICHYMKNYGGGKIQKSNKKSLKAKGKGKANGKGKDKQVYIPKPKNPKPSAKEHPAMDDTSHHCKEVGHCKRNCPTYLAELIKKKKQDGTVSSSDVFKIELFSFPTKSWVYDTSCGTYICNTKHGLEGLTPPYTPQLNGVSERRNRTLLDMVRSMINLTTLPLSFWDYALESATRILNMVPAKKVDKTLYELWYGKVPNLSYLKVWGCEALVKRDTPDKLEQRSSGGFEPPQEEVIPIRRSERTHRAPNRLCLNVEVEEHSLGDLNEPTSYKAAMLTLNLIRRIDAMNAKYNSDGQYVWVLSLAKFYSTLWFDYEEMFSDPVADIRAIRILISIAAFFDYEIWQMDEKTAFLNGYLDEDIYMDLGEAKFILGSQNAIEIDRRTNDLVKNAYMIRSYRDIRWIIPSGTIPNARKADLNKITRCTRPDFAFAQNITSRFQQNPGELHWTAVKNILKYLRNTKDMFLVYGGNPKAELRVDCY
ncbi:retrotransposon protein, putative, ty1-copia subclass [Tanacetum coccineum]